MRLAEVYEGLGEKEKSLEILRHVMQILKNQRAAEAAQISQGQASASENANANEDGQLSFFDEMGTTSLAKSAPSAKRARMNYNRQQRLKLELQREQETQLSWRRLELLEPHVFIDHFWRYDVASQRKAKKHSAASTIRTSP